MNPKSALPDSAKVQQTLANAQHTCQEMEQVGQQLEDVIAQLEQANHQSHERVLQGL